MGRLRSLIRILTLAALAGPTHCPAADNEARTLWYKQPASAWTRALPVGNGRFAAMVLGGVHQDRVQLNEDTVGSGEERNGSNPEAPKSFPEVRRLLLEGHPAEAEAQALADRISIPRALPVYQTLGDLWLDFGGPAPQENYRRELDLDTGIASVRYTSGGVRYQKSKRSTHNIIDSKDRSSIQEKP